MEIERRCSECRHVFDGHPLGQGLFLCPECGSPHTTILWTDESLDPPDGYVYPEDDEDSFEEEEDND